MKGDEYTNKLEPGQASGDPDRSSADWLDSMLSEKRRLDREVAVAREIQFSTLPSVFPQIPGYDVHGRFVPADHAGGDLFDLVMIEGRLFILLGDATGHGFGPALSATQMQAMLRVAFRCGADLDTAYCHVNNQLEEDLPADRFITAFIGFLDPVRHRIRYHSCGQGPILHVSQDPSNLDWADPTTYPLGAVVLQRAGEGASLVMEPGDSLLLFSDGVYETRDPAGRVFGQEGVADTLRAYPGAGAEELVQRVLDAVNAFRQGADQEDDITAVAVRRLSEGV